MCIHIAKVQSHYKGKFCGHIYLISSYLSIAKSLWTYDISVFSQNFKRRLTLKFTLHDFYEILPKKFCPKDLTEILSAVDRYMTEIPQKHF